MDNPTQLPHAVPFAKEDVAMDHEDAWRELNTKTGNIVGWPPITLKALYILGIIDDFCEAANTLLYTPKAWPTFYLPAYGLVASGIELLGRSVHGEPADSGTVNTNFRHGFRYIQEATPRPDLGPDDVIVTNRHTYTISELIALRHFTLHGQATFRTDPDLNIELLDSFPTLIAAALEKYWNALQVDVELCEKLGRANVVPFAIRLDPIVKMLRFFQAGHTVTAVFTRFNFHVAHRYP